MIIQYFEVIIRHFPRLNVNLSIWWDLIKNEEKQYHKNKDENKNKHEINKCKNINLPQSAYAWKDRIAGAKEKIHLIMLDISQLGRRGFFSRCCPCVYWPYC